MTYNPVSGPLEGQTANTRRCRQQTVYVCMTSLCYVIIQMDGLVDLAIIAMNHRFRPHILLLDPILTATTMNALDQKMYQLLLFKIYGTLLMAALEKT